MKTKYKATAIMLNKLHDEVQRMKTITQSAMSDETKFDLINDTIKSLNNDLANTLTYFQQDIKQINGNGTKPNNRIAKR